jgi:hypothetical protein
MEPRQAVRTTATGGQNGTRRAARTGRDGRPERAATGRGCADECADERAYGIHDGRWAQGRARLRAREGAAKKNGSGI